MPLPKLNLNEIGDFVDSDGKIFTLRGVNFDPSVKYPASPFQPSHIEIDIEHDSSFIGHPIELNELRTHITRLKSIGCNCIRLPITWESLEHKAPEEYDFEYMDYIIEVLDIFHEMGDIYIYIDPHQDVWSRFTGGSGAPLWTLYCCGFNPRNFEVTNAAVLHSFYTEQEQDKYLKMLWTTNYFKLACSTMFTLFFAGKIFTPNLIINGQNIQEYLQNKFINAFITLYDRIKTKRPIFFQHNLILGMESINEPNNGYIGKKCLDKIPKDRNLKLGLTPTTLQSFMLGEGYNCNNMAYYNLSIFGPMKAYRNRACQPNGTKCWLMEQERMEIDKKFKWKRSANWEAGKCIWRQMGVWDIVDGKPKLLKPNYFSEFIDKTQDKDIGKVTILDKSYFINKIFMEYYAKFYSKFRAIDEDNFIIIQPPVLEIPPILKENKLIDSKTIYALHYYDGFSLMFKTWNQNFTIDTLGVLRGTYINPILGIKVGKGNVRKSLQKQLKMMKDEVQENVGTNVGIIFSEIGLPMDMNNKKSFIDLNDNYKSQTNGMDTILRALESNNLSFTLWCYCHTNTHKWGDGWNDEDFSIWSNDELSNKCQDVLFSSINYATENQFIIQGDNENLRRLVSTTSGRSLLPVCSIENIDLEGFRTLNVLIRPFIIQLQGKFEEFEVELDKYEILLILNGDCKEFDRSNSFIFLPQYHFKLQDLEITSSSGKIIYYKEYQILQWNHEYGRQYLKIKRRK